MFYTDSLVWASNTHGSGGFCLIKASALSGAQYPESGMSV